MNFIDLSIFSYGACNRCISTDILLQLAAAPAPAVRRLVRQTVGRLVRGLADRQSVG